MTAPFGVYSLPESSVMDGGFVFSDFLQEVIIPVIMKIKTINEYNTLV
jgi:hypothetical protein